MRGTNWDADPRRQLIAVGQAGDDSLGHVHSGQSGRKRKLAHRQLSYQIGDKISMVTTACLYPSPESGKVGWRMRGQGLRYRTLLDDSEQFFGDGGSAGRWRCDGCCLFEFHPNREQCREWRESEACEAQWKEATHTPLRSSARRIRCLLTSLTRV